MTIFLLLWQGGATFKYNLEKSIPRLGGGKTDPNKLNIRKKSQESYESYENPIVAETGNSGEMGDASQLILPRSNITLTFRGGSSDGSSDGSKGGSGGSLLAELERSNKKNKQGQSCTPLDEVLRASTVQSLQDYAFVTSCNKQNYKNSACYIKVTVVYCELLIE